MRHSSKAPRPHKPYPDFPFFPHLNGQWAKVIRGGMHYIGSWKTATWQEALGEFQRQAPALYNGQQPDPKPQGMTIKEMVNHFMHHSSLKVKAGELKQRTWNEYQTYGNRIIDVLGADFPLEAVGPRAGEKLFEAMTKCHASPHSLEGDKAKIMVFFNYANDQDFTERPMKLGPLFRRANPISQVFAKLTKKLHLHRKGRGFHASTASCRATA